MILGIEERLEMETLVCAPDSMTVKDIRVWVPPQRKYSAWLGGSMLASLSTFQQKVSAVAWAPACVPGGVHVLQGCPPQ